MGENQHSERECSNQKPRYRKQRNILHPLVYTSAERDVSSVRLYVRLLPVSFIHFLRSHSRSLRVSFPCSLNYPRSGARKELPRPSIPITFVLDGHVISPFFQWFVSMALRAPFGELERGSDFCNSVSTARLLERNGSRKADVWWSSPP